MVVRLAGSRAGAAAGRHARRHLWSTRAKPKLAAAETLQQELSAPNTAAVLTRLYAGGL
jgi:hypothetical protein